MPSSEDAKRSACARSGAMQTEILFSTLNNEAAALHVAKALSVHKLGKTFTQASDARISQRPFSIESCRVSLAHRFAARGALDFSA
jgi:hypothetical protein